jgi:hypothetical protein
MRVRRATPFLVLMVAATVGPFAALGVSPAAAESGPPFSAIFDRRDVRCGGYDSCLFRPVFANSATGASVQADLRLERGLLQPTSSSDITSSSGFTEVLNVPQGARSVTATFRWTDVKGEALVVGGGALPGRWNQFHLRLLGTAFGCDGCDVKTEFGPLMGATSNLPIASMEHSSLLRTVTISAADGRSLPRTVTVVSYFSTSGTYLGDYGKVEGSYGGNLVSVDAIWGY